MAQYELLLPKMGESVAEATIIKWVKAAGEAIDADESVLEIATDKVDSEVPSPVAGTLVKTLFNEGCILIDFEMVKPVSVTIKDAVYKGENVKNVSVKLNTIRLKLSDTKSEIHFIEYSRFNKNLDPYILSIR